MTNQVQDALKFLIVEDDAVSRMVASGILKKLQLNHDCAANGQEALDALHANGRCYNAIFMDCDMPVMNGFEAVKFIRQAEADGALTAIPVFAVTSHSGDDFEKKILASGFNRLITKPLTVQAVVAALASIGLALDQTF